LVHVGHHVNEFTTCSINGTWPTGKGEDSEFRIQDSEGLGTRDEGLGLQAIGYPLKGFSEHSRTAL
jgi:hypothetical protein